MIDIWQGYNIDISQGDQTVAEWKIDPSKQQLTEKPLSFNNFISMKF